MYITRVDIAIAHSQYSEKNNRKKENVFQYQPAGQRHQVFPTMFLLGLFSFNVAGDNIIIRITAHRKDHANDFLLE